MKRKNSVKKELIIILVVMITYYTYIRNGRLTSGCENISCGFVVFKKGILNTRSVQLKVISKMVYTISTIGFFDEFPVEYGYNGIIIGARIRKPLYTTTRALSTYNGRETRRTTVCGIGKHAVYAL